jgi:nicotinate-nucleotide adenylyltransferase
VRLGIFGGTFDPPHVGHLLAAGDALELLQLDRVIFVPNSLQPLKDRPLAPAQDRAAMVRAMLAGDNRFLVDNIEIDRGGDSFTVDTLEQLRSKHRGANLFLLAGVDSLRSFSRWKNPSRILELATTVALTRADVSVNIEAQNSGGGADLPVGTITIGTRTIDISSSEIRNRIKNGKPVRGMVTEAVERIILEKGLYK